MRTFISFIDSVGFLLRLNLSFQAEVYYTSSHALCKISLDNVTTYYRVIVNGYSSVVIHLIIAHYMLPYLYVLVFNYTLSYSCS